MTAEDAMAVDWVRLPHDLLARITNRIVNEVPTVNGVVYELRRSRPAR